MFHIDFNINEISITNGAKAYIIKLYRFWCPVVWKCSEFKLYLTICTFIRTSIMKNIIFIAIFLLSIETASSRFHHFDLYGCYTQTTPLYDEVKSITYTINDPNRRISFSNKKKPLTEEMILQKSSTVSSVGNFCIKLTSLHATSTIREHFTYNVGVSNNGGGGYWPIVFRQGASSNTWYMNIDEDKYSGLCIALLTTKDVQENDKFLNQSSCQKNLKLNLRAMRTYSIMLQYNPNAASYGERNARASSPE